MENDDAVRATKSNPRSTPARLEAGFVMMGLPMSWTTIWRTISCWPDNFPLAKGAVLPASEGVRFSLLVILTALCAGCATDPEGKRLNAWQTMQKWDDSMSETEARLQNKNYSR